MNTTNLSVKACQPQSPSWFGCLGGRLNTYQPAGIRRGTATSIPTSFGATSDPASLGVGIEDDPHPPEVTLELLARIAVGHLLAASLHGDVGPCIGHAV